MRKACSLLPVFLSGALGHRRMMSMLTALLLFAYSGITLALTCQSNATGNWNVAGTWTTCGGGIPGAGDDVQIRNAHVVTIPAAFGATANSLTFTVTNGAARLDHAAATSTLTVGAGGVTFNASGNNNIRSWNINAGSATVNGALDINGGGNNSRIARIQITTGSLDANGNLTMTAGNAVRTVIDMSGGAGNLFVAGSFSLASGNGTLTPGTSSTVTLDSATTPVTVATGSSIAYHHLVIAKGVGSVANAATTGALTVGGNLTVTSGTFNIPGITATVTGETNISGTLAFITSAAGTKAFTGNVTINSGGFWTNDTVDSPVTLRGNFTNNGTFAAGTGVYTFDGTAVQSITGTNAGTTTFGSLTLNNANGLTLGGAHNVTVSNVLALTNGVLTTGGNVLSVTNSAAGGVTRTGGFVDGSLTWALPTGDSGVRTFPLGTGTTYSPVALTFTGVTTGGNITARAIAGDHPDVANSGVNESLSVNRYWSVSNSGVAFANYDAVFTWVAGDLDVGADTNVFEAQRLDGTWNATTPGTRTATSIQVTSLAGFGEFAIGQPLAVAGGIGRFNAYDTGTAAGAVTGFITTKVAGTFDVHIIAISNNRKSIQTNYNGTVRVELLNASDNSGTPDASTGCNSSWTVIQTIAPDLVFVGADNGRKPIAVTENNAWRAARFRITEQPGGALIGCSTDAFAIRPASIVVSATDTDWATAGSGRTLDNGSATGGNVHRAGRPFTINVVPSPGSAANYDGTPTVSAVACTPVGCVNGTFDIGTFPVSGPRVSDTASYSEAGVFDLTLIDETYTLIDATDGTPADCSATGRFICQSAAPLAVGRFVPDRFEFSAPSTPMLLTFGENTCATRSFTYVGQPFWYNPLMLPSATLQAVNAAGVVTANYPLDTATLRPAIGESYADAAAPVAAPLDVSAIDSPAATSGAGSGTYTASTAGQLRYDHSATTPVVPFNAAIALTVTATDSTESAVAGNGTISATSPQVFDGGGTGIAFDAGSGFRYGRLRLTGASGSQLLKLRVPVETQYWDGTFFITNVADGCTTLATTNIGLGNYIRTGSGTTTVDTVTSPLSSGRGSITLNAPAADVRSVDVAVNLGPVPPGTATADACPAPAFAPPATAANKAYLRGKWCDPPGTHTKDPSARARFGIQRGSDERIYMRENYN